MVEAVAVDSLRRQIRSEVAAPAEELAAAFFDLEGPFAATTFDELPNNRRDGFTSEDLLAVSLLDVRFEPRAVRALIKSGSERWTPLRDIPNDRDLWDATDDDLRNANALWDQVIALPGVGPTKTSKLLARKRPRLIPIVDRIIRNALPLGEDAWESLRAALQDERLRAEIEEIRPAGLPDTVSTLRLLDVVVWMRHSESRNARLARRQAGLT
jgi:hypothetical protein